MKNSFAFAFSVISRHRMIPCRTFNDDIVFIHLALFQADFSLRLTWSWSYQFNTRLSSILKIFIGSVSLIAIVLFRRMAFFLQFILYLWIRIHIRGTCTLGGLLRQSVGHHLCLSKSLGPVLDIRHLYGRFPHHDPMG